MNGNLYYKWREICLERDWYHCQECGVTSRWLEVHHIKSATAFPEFKFVLSNGITLCKPCHREKHMLANKMRNKKWQNQ